MDEWEWSIGKVIAPVDLDLLLLCFENVYNGLWSVHKGYCEVLVHDNISSIEW